MSVAEMIAAPPAGVGLIFKPDNVLSILAGTKTQTRRLLHIPAEVMPNRELLEPDDSVWRHVGAGESCGVFAVWRETPDGAPADHNTVRLAIKSPYGTPGDHVWVREAWRAGRTFDALEPGEIQNGSRVHYEAGLNAHSDDAPPLGKLRNPLFMPRWASRITARVMKVRLQRLMDITDGDAIAEGVQRTSRGFVGGKNHLGGVQFFETARDAYLNLWDEINAPSRRAATRGRPGAWAKENPGVWAVSFELVRP